MRAIRVVEPGKAKTVEVPDPIPVRGESVIAVRRIGLCGTDLRTYLGTNPIVEYPRIIGHEVGALLEEATTISGTRYEPGTVVTVNPYTTCGRCPACRSGRHNACQYNETMGNQRDGAGMERIALPPDKLYALPGLTVDAAAAIEPLSVGFHAAHRGEVTSDDTVVVLGTGVIGLGAVAGAAARGARVVAVDLDGRKLKLAKALGARVTINGARESVFERVLELTGGEGASVVIEAIGLPGTYRQAVDLVCFTGRVVYIGYAKEDVAFTTKLFVAKELDIRGSRNAMDEDFRAVIEAIRNDTVPVQTIITQRYPMGEVDAAFSFWKERPNDVTKIVLKVD